MRLYFPLTPCSWHHSPNFRTKASGISRGKVFQGWRYSLGEDLLELGDAEVGQVHQAGGVVDDQADRHPVAGIDDADPGRGGAGR